MKSSSQILQEKPSAINLDGAFLDLDGQVEKADAAKWFKRLVSVGRDCGKFCESMTITPARAAVMLEKNKENRTIVASGVKKWSLALIAGDWEDNGETVKISIDGDLNDGQHRLLAVVETGIALTTFIAFGLSRESRKTVDLGSKRTSAHVLHMSGMPNAALSATTAKFHINLRMCVSLNTSRSGKEILREIEEFPTIVVHRNSPNKAARLFHQSTGLFQAISIMAAESSDWKKSDEFFGFVFSPIGVSNPNHAAAVLNSRLQKNLGAKAKLPLTEVAAITIKAWNAFITGRPVGVLRWISQGDAPEAFPRIY